MAVTVTRTAPPSTPTGFTATAVNGFAKCYSEESGNLIDRTTEFTTIGTDVAMFVADDDYVYFSLDSPSSDTRISKLHFVLSVNASESIVPTFEYNTGDNSWATLPVTDGTNGFTQNGSIVVDESTFPTYSTWQVGSQDGNGSEIGDSADRRYIRIKRTSDTLTTPPQISESGLGNLSASTTYYYRACALVLQDSLGTGAHTRSAPTSEVSATTTTVKRSIKLDWDVDGVSPYRGLWRTPTSGDYDVVKRETRSDEVDTHAQSVKCVYFDARADSTGTNNTLLDDGLSHYFTYSATNHLYGYYRAYSFKDFTQGIINVSEGTSGSGAATFDDIYDADVSNGWGTFTSIGDFTTSTTHDIYLCHDHIVIDDYFTDTYVTLITDGLIKTLSTSTCVFGHPGTSNYGDYYLGVNFLMCGDNADDYSWVFYNSKFYDCKFIQVGVLRPDSFVRFAFFYDDCELYDCTVESVLNLQTFSFSGPRIIVRNTKITKLRYGLTTTADAADIDVDGLTIQGCPVIYDGVWADGAEITFRNITGVNTTQVFRTYSGVDRTYTLNCVNFDLTKAAAGYTGFTTAWIGPLWTIYEKYTFNLKVVDNTGDEIENADVAITDLIGNTVDLTTDANGDITQQDLIAAKYTAGTLVNATYHQYYPDVVETRTPHTVIVSKEGYVSKTVKYTMDRTREEIETLDTQVKWIIPQGKEIYFNHEPTNSQNQYKWIKS